MSDVAEREAHAAGRKQRQRAGDRDVRAQEEGGVEGPDGDGHVARENATARNADGRRAAIRNAPFAPRPDGVPAGDPRRRRARGRRSTRRNNRASRLPPRARASRAPTEAAGPRTPSATAPGPPPGRNEERRGGAASSAQSGASQRAALREGRRASAAGCAAAFQSQGSRRSTWPAPTPMRRRRDDLGRDVLRRVLARDALAGEDDSRARRAPPAPGSGSRPWRSCRAGSGETSARRAGIDAAVGAEADAERAPRPPSGASRGPSTRTRAWPARRPALRSTSRPQAAPTPGAARAASERAHGARLEARVRVGEDEHLGGRAHARGRSGPPPFRGASGNSTTDTRPPPLRPPPRAPAPPSRRRSRRSRSAMR